LFILFSFLILFMAPTNKPRKKTQRKVRTARNAAPRNRKAGSIVAGGNLASTQRTLARRPKTKNMAAIGDLNYLMCRLDPFHATNSLGIPDGGNSNYVVADYLVYSDVLCTSAFGFTLQTFAALPFSACIFGNGGPSVTDITVTPSSAPAIVYFNGSTLANFTGILPINVVPPLFAQGLSIPGGYMPGNAIDDIWNSTSARLVSISHKVVYTGTPVSASGTITVSPNTLAFAIGGSAPFSSYVTYAPDQTTVFSAPNIVPVLDVDGTIISNYTKDSVIFRPELGATVVSKHRSNDYKNIPTSDVPYGALANKSITTLPSTNINAFCTPGIGNNNAGVIWFDNDWTGHNITVRGVGVGNTFRVETSYCFEINPSTVSNIYPFTLKQSPKMNSAILSRAQTLTGSRPAATPYLGEH
jgi:hypothetical protein